MSPSPYRTRPLEDRVAGPNKRRFDEGAIVAALGLFWALSLFRVFGGLIRHETFGAEGTLALLAVFAAPWLIWGR